VAESMLQQRIKELAAHHGSMRVLGRVLEVYHAYLHRLSTGEKDDPGPELLRKLKLRRVVTYERTDTVDAHGRMRDEMRAFIEGMSVSVDVSTCEQDADRRYFGTVTEVMDDRFDKHGVTLLVQNAKPNWKDES
jgi:hypothetical protein